MKKILLQFLLLSLSASAANKTWTGAISNNWNVAANWSGGIPANGDKIVIDPSNYSTGTTPVISSASLFSPESILVQNGGSLTINAALTITGDITVTSTSTLTTTDATNGFVYFNGTNNLYGTGTFIFPNIVINNNKTLNQNTTPIINVKGNWTNNDGIFISNSNKVIFIGTVVQQINGTSITQTFYDFEIAKTAQSLRIGGNLTTLNVHDFTQTSFKFHDSALSMFNVSGNFIHTSGTFVPCNNIIISGNIIDNDNAQSTRLIWGTMLTLNGTRGQTIGGTHPATFNKLIINNTGASGITLEQAVNIDSSLTLTNGIIYSDAVNLLIIKKNAICTSGSNSSFVDGPVKKTGATSFVFPVGNAKVWARLGILNNENFGTTTEFTCTYHKTSAPSNANEFMSAEINHVSYAEYWNLERTYDTGNDARCNVKLYWEDTSRSGINNLVDLKVAHFSSTFNFYENKGGIISASGKTGTITSTIPSTSFSPFTFGSSTGLNPLPIELLSFDAKIIPDNKVKILWEVASENNNDYFTIERSADGIYYEAIAKLKGAGTCHHRQTYSFIDEFPFQDISYYRLKQTDYDGKCNYHKSVHVVFTMDETASLIYPNPLCCNMPLWISTSSDSTKEIQLLVIDNAGKTICKKTIMLSKGFNQTKVIEDEFNLPKGLYSVIIIDRKEYSRFKLIVQ